MKIDDQNEATILAELGVRLVQARLDHNFTQEKLASAAAVSKRTVERLEAGRSVQVSNLVRVLSALDLARNLDQLVPPAGMRPIDQIKHQGKSRRRASPAKGAPATAWTWNDEK